MIPKSTAFVEHTTYSFSFSCSHAQKQTHIHEHRPLALKYTQVQMHGLSSPALGKASDSVRLTYICRLKHESDSFICSNIQTVFELMNDAQTA